MLIAEQIFLNTCRATFGKFLHDSRFLTYLLSGLTSYRGSRLSDWQIGSLGIALLRTLPTAPVRPQLLAAIEAHANRDRLVHETNVLLADYWPNLARLLALKSSKDDLDASRLAIHCGSAIESPLIRVFERHLLVTSGSDIGDWLQKATPTGPQSLGLHVTKNLANLVGFTIRDVMTRHRGVVYLQLPLECLRQCLGRLHHLNANQTPTDALRQLQQGDPLQRHLIEAAHELPQLQRFILIATAFGGFPIDDLAIALSEDDAAFESGKIHFAEVFGELQIAWKHAFNRIL